MMRLAMLLVCSLLIFSACKSSKTTTEDPSTDEDRSFLLVLLQPNVTPGQLENDLKEYGLKAEGRTSKSQNQWQLSYLSNSIGYKELLATLSQYESVLDASLLEASKDVKVSSGTSGKKGKINISNK